MEACLVPPMKKLCNLPGLGAGRHAIALAAAVLFGLPGRAAAQHGEMPVTAPEECAVRASLPPGYSPQAIDIWLQALGQCQRDAVYLATLGQMLSRQGRYHEASDHLERALLFNPDLKEARVDYAIALAGAGDIVSAQAMLDGLLSEPGLPPWLRESLQTQSNALAGVEGTGWLTRMSITTRLGHDSNLSGAPNLGSLTLTVAGQPVLLPLDESYQARSGTYARADLQLEMRRKNSDGSRWDVLASLRARHSPSVAKAGTSTAEIQAEHSHQRVLEGTMNTAGYYAGVAAGALQAQAGTRYFSLGAMAGVAMQWHEGRASGCQGRLGGELQQRQHQTNSVLTGHYMGLAASLSCENAGGIQWLGSLRAGRDMAQDMARPGGDQQQAGVRLAGYMPMSVLLPGVRHVGILRGGLLMDAEASRYRDAAGYSPILQNGAIRTLARQTARIEYQFAVAKTLHWTVGAEWVRQRSSLELFQLQSQGPYTALRAIW